MAEFQEVMNQWKRMCSTHVNCAQCPLQHCISPRHSSWDINPDAERIIMDWAAEHPEPVYPTWDKWLITQGVIKENPNGGIGYPMPKLIEPIPADIAQKLGLELKGEA